MSSAIRATERDIRMTCQVLTATRRIAGIVEDARCGLLSRPRRMPPKYFYDERGGKLFDAICDTPEYYPTRIEQRLLADSAGEILALTRPEHIVEFGSGASRKTRHLLDACARAGLPSQYWPLDVCESMLIETGRSLLDEYPWLTVNARVGDCLGGLRHLTRAPGSRLFLFLGGTIGNFSPSQTYRFLIDVREAMDDDDWLLLGADRVKDAGVLHAAYNDAAGLTADFNLNLLRVLNRELDADFDIGGFEHEAFYNETLQQIEMYLRATGPQRVRLGKLDTEIEIANEEHIQTEISRKYTEQSLADMMMRAGFLLHHHFVAPQDYFSLLLVRPDPARKIT
jgi:L-histidine N-alpha-methyltransferase